MEKARISEDSADPSTNCDWSQLQADLLVQIFGSLDIPDLFSSGAVCRSWHLNYLEARRLRLCSPNQSPCLVYSSGDSDANTATLHNMSTNKLYHVTLSEPAFRTRYVMGSSHGWLITADERSNLIFVNPVTRAEIVMPPPETMNNVRLRYTEEGVLDGYDILSLDLISRDFGIEAETYDVTLEEGRIHFYERVVLSCVPSNGNCIVFRVHLPYDHLSYARVGDTKWTWIDANEDCWRYQDILYNNSDGLFYGVRGRGEIDSIDLSGPSAEVKAILKPVISYQLLDILFEHHGEIFCRYGDTIDLMRRMGKWNELQPNFLSTRSILLNKSLCKQIASKSTHCSLVSIALSCFPLKISLR